MDLFQCDFCPQQTRQAHLMSKGHQLNQLEFINCKYIPTPKDDHLQALTDLLTATYKKICISEEELKYRMSFIPTLQTRLRSYSPILSNVELEVYGSVSSGLALNYSDTNVRIKAPQNSSPAAILHTTYDCIRSMGGSVRNWKNDFVNEHPHISFCEGDSNSLYRLQFADDSNLVTTRLLAQYVKWNTDLKQICCLFKHLAKICHIADHRLGFLPSHSFPIMAIFYFQQKLGVPVLKVDDEEPRTSSPLKKSLGELWLNLLQFYATELDLFVSITGAALIKKIDRKCKYLKLAIEEPGLPKHNLARALSHQEAGSFIKNQLTLSYAYYATPQAAYTLKYIRRDKVEEQNADEEPDDLSYLDDDKKEIIWCSEADYSHGSTVDEKVEVVSEQNLAMTALEVDIKSLELVDGDLSNPAETTVVTQLVRSHIGPTLVSDGIVSPPGSELGEKDDSPRLKEQNVDKEPDYLFYLDDDKFPLADVPPPISPCSYCQQSGHFNDNCPLDKQRACESLLPTTHELMTQLQKDLVGIKEGNQLQSEDIIRRENLLQFLKRVVVKIHPAVHLRLFGSSCNGFGTKSSDVDISMTFDGNEELDKTAIIEKLAKLLESTPGFNRVMPITTAKVPIVKFYDRLFRLHGDISLYNTLALRNTTMLRRYSEIDDRVKVLGYAVKDFAKKHEIGDASEGSLSSYAYILMMLHYLQQCEPPVIPVLQQLHGEHQPCVIVEECNTYFLDVDNDTLAQIWPHIRQNNMSLAELWVGFFDYYASKFNYKMYVVTIRQKDLLSKLDKLWNSSKLAIEDPFDLKHNLGRGLTMEKNVKILTSIYDERSKWIKTEPSLAWELFGKRPKKSDSEECSDDSSSEDPNN